MNTRRFWELFPDLTEAVRGDYISCGVLGGAHDFYHALAVAQYAALIAEDDRSARLGWVAGLCHEHPHRLFARGAGERILQHHLSEHTTYVTLSLEDRHDVITAILEHSGKNNLVESLLLTTLKDADRLANLGALHWLRASQFRHDIPAVNPRFIIEQDPTATFRNPKSVLRDIENTLEWETWLRLPKAQELGKPLFEEIRRLKEKLIQRFTLLGLYPLPPELVVE